MDKQPTFENRVVGVFRDRGTAERAARAAQRAAGLSDKEVQIDAEPDERFALRGEMREEVDHTVAGPGPVGPYTKEMTKGLVRSHILWVPIGIVVALPLAFIPIGDTSLGFRLVLWGIVGAIAAAVAALAIGGGLSAKGPSEPMAAERGVTVGITVNSVEQARSAAGALSQHDPIRVDTGVAERPTGMVTREPEDEKAREGKLLSDGE
ncbi:MAG TPA: hypothetical protein VHI54_00005 [Actinomycetota bacterium]|nr:hypothetical protein [Actinomycetota bacterium]